MPLPKKYILPAIAFALATGGAVTINSVAQADTTTQSQNLAATIASKFHLNEGDVEQVLREHHQEMEVFHEQERQAHLQALVDEGKLTQAQKDALIAKMEEMHTKRVENKERFRSMTKEERQKERETHRQEMDQWFHDQGIEKSLLRPDFDGQKRGPHHEE